MQIFKKLFILFFLGQVLFLTSCNSTKQIVYFQGDTSRYIPLKRIQPNIYKIQTEDILGVTVSSLNEEANKIFEMPIAVGLRYMAFPGSQLGGQGLQPLGYQVDSVGMIEMPLIGKVKVKGLSFVEASDSIKLKLDTYLKNPSVNVRVLNHKYTILGEVNKPSTYNLLDNKTTILEAIGLAGDMTIYGRRDNILLVRDDQLGRKQVRLNLLDREILNSEYFYIKNGDILYIEPSTVKSTFNDRTYQLLPIATSIISAVTSLGVLFLSVTK